MRKNLVSDKHTIYFLPTIELKIDDMLAPVKVNYILWIGWLWFKLRITWFKERKDKYEY